jgi:hypothetical protein
MAISESISSDFNRLRRISEPFQAAGGPRRTRAGFVSHFSEKQ